MNVKSEVLGRLWRRVALTFMSAVLALAVVLP